MELLQVHRGACFWFVIRELPGENICYYQGTSSREYLLLWGNFQQCIYIRIYTIPPPTQAHSLSCSIYKVAEGWICINHGEELQGIKYKLCINCFWFQVKVHHIPCFWVAMSFIQWRFGYIAILHWVQVILDTHVTRYWGYWGFSWKSFPLDPVNTPPFTLQCIAYIDSIYTHTAHSEKSEWFHQKSANSTQTARQADESLIWVRRADIELPNKFANQIMVKFNGVQ